MAAKTNATLDEILKKLEEAEKEFDLKMKESNLSAILSAEETRKNKMKGVQ